MRARALDRGGAAAAFLVGTLTYGSGGWPFTLVLLAFFLPSVGLSRVGRGRKKALVDIGKGGARDAAQVFANGGVATACAVAATIFAGGRHPPALGASGLGPWLAAFAGAYAAATADTWGTEIGTLARGTPHSILTLRPIATGLSGGVTGWGMLAEAAGAVWLAGSACLCLWGLAGPAAPNSGRNAAAACFTAVALGGILGALADSVLGATVQELRHCPVCDRDCETNPHVCGSPTRLVRGVRGFSNDLVNFAATLVGEAIAYLAFVSLA